MFKKFLSAFLSLSLVFSLTAPAFAAEPEQNNFYSSEIVFSAADEDFINKVVSVADYWYINETTGQLSITLSETELKNDFQFSETQYERLMSKVVGVSVAPTAENAPMPAFYISGGALYIEYTDLVGGVFAGLYAAASVGEAAMAAALAAVSTAISGPVGTVITGILAVIAAPSLTELCGRVIWAVATQQGIYIKPVLSYPPLEMGYFS